MSCGFSSHVRCQGGPKDLALYLNWRRLKSKRPNSCRSASNLSVFMLASFHIHSILSRSFSTVQVENPRSCATALFPFIARDNCLACAKSELQKTIEAVSYNKVIPAVSSTLFLTWKAELNLECGLCRVSAPSTPNSYLILFATVGIEEHSH